MNVLRIKKKKIHVLLRKIVPYYFLIKFSLISQVELDLYFAFDL